MESRSSLVISNNENDDIEKPRNSGERLCRVDDHGPQLIDPSGQRRVEAGRQGKTAK